MIRTITIGTCVSIQGLFERLTPAGTMIVRVGGQTYEGKPVGRLPAAGRTASA
ncbi:hypothetical protein [Paracoccus sp. S-4012]|uniref:hypothetical protein n=1 Tax=Paracoccus sp. S-4012 TaxID=2665648 RepID=UPI0018A21589|nr:hypothetical protein [Paracoccus sp. S-4012]